MNIGAVAEFQNVSQPPEKLHLHRGPIAFHSQIETAFGMRPWRSDGVFQRSPQADEARENSEYGVWNHSPARASKGKDRFAVAENYPQLKANDNFLKLQNRISELEERIADRREFFNDDVNTYNTRIGQIPEVFLASFMNLKPRAMFKVSDEDRRQIEVKFQGQTAAGA